MDKVIQTLINIENKAQSVVEDARTMKSELQKTIDNGVDSIRQEISGRVEIKRETIKKIEEDIADKKLKAINTQIAEAEAKMEEKYQENSDAWVNQIFDKIIKI